MLVSVSNGWSNSYLDSGTATSELERAVEYGQQIEVTDKHSHIGVLLNSIQLLSNEVMRLRYLEKIWNDPRSPTNGW